MNEDEVRRLRGQMKLLQRRLRRESEPAGGVSGSALQVLLALSRLPPGTPPGELATELRMAGPNVAAALRELEGAGHVERERDGGDRRRVLVGVTASGKKLLADIGDERDSWLARAIESTLGEAEQRRLVEAGAMIERLAEFEP